MKAFGRWSIISLIRFIVQFAWSLMLAPIVVFSGIFLYLLVTGEQLPWVGLSVYIDSVGSSSVTDIIGTKSVLFGAISGAETFYVSSQHISLFSVTLGVVQICLMVYIFYTLTVLKRPLNAMALNKVYKIENGKDLRHAAFLLLAAAPLKYGYDWLSKINVENIIQSTDVNLLAPPFDFTLLFAGCICYLFAEILNQATLMHDEQKLTV